MTLTLTRWIGVLAAVASIAGGVVALGYASERRDAEPIGPGDAVVELTSEHSRFVPDRLVVRSGTTVRFVINNTDPIGHELILGDEAVHARHATGTEAHHPPVPGEVSLNANSTASTTFRFDSPGRVEFACHLPGHYDFGMHGTVVVKA